MCVCVRERERERERESETYTERETEREREREREKRKRGREREIAIRRLFSDNVGRVCGTRLRNTGAGRYTRGAMVQPSGVRAPGHPEAPFPARERRRLATGIGLDTADCTRRAEPPA